MAGQLHSHALGHTGTNQVPHSRSPEIVRDPPWASRFVARVPPGLPDRWLDLTRSVKQRRTVLLKHIRHDLIAGTLEYPLGVDLSDNGVVKSAINQTMSMFCQ